MYYLYKDHLGSITAITNQSGAVIERHSFDAWGRLRNPSNWTFNNIPAMTILDRGYTGHEHLGDFGLINMNGRMYDPLIGQMLSPDPYVQDIAGSQGFNRYSYCLNNPLKYTDPSGENPLLLIGIAVGVAVNLAVNASKIHNGMDFYAYAFTGAFTGALGGIFGAGVGVAQGAMLGAASGFSAGFVVGAGNAWIAGEDVRTSLRKGLQGGLMGGAMGAVAGGISGGIEAIKHGGNLWTGEGATHNFLLSTDAENTITVGKNMEYSTKYAKKFSDKYFKEVKNVDNLYADGRVAKGLTKQGDLVFNKSGKTVGASCVYNGIGKGSDVYLYKAAFISKEQLYLVMGHEYIHVYFNAKGFSYSVRGQERAAYKWSIDQAKAWNMSTTHYEKIYSSFWSKHMYPVLDYKDAGIIILNSRPW